ncbi:TolC family protein [Geomesophilobacter sediminis]|uniref:TolC family protein n=1 Tax=Geomesophilobacter sediminis TaxID=2798584 RepID=A0A8J7J7T7_9BACT|nr:TolC family protein [Geomesophilobacter sediminis]MBJ6725471.1 TolC family protein [Geomesophilobacter sediminis]
MLKQIVSLSIALVVGLATAAGAETLTLQQSLESAARRNQTLKTYAYQSRIAAEDEKVAASGYLPRIDLNGGYTAQLEPQSMSVGGFTAPTQQADYAFFSAGIDQTLYDFGRTASRVDRARAGTEAARQEYRAREQEVFLRVVQAYYGILETEQLLAAADEEVRQMGGHLTDAQSKYQQGVVTRNDVLQAEVKLANSKQRRLEIARQLDNTWLLLNNLTGREPVQRAQLQDLPPAEPEVNDATAAARLGERPELKAARASVAASEAAVTEQKANFRPEFYLRAGLDYTQNRYVEEPAILAATVGVRFNVFDGKAKEARLRQAVQARSQQEENLRDVEQSARLEYQTAVHDAQVARQRIATTEKAVGQAEENLRLNRTRYEEQMGTSTDVVDAQTLLTQARTDYFQALFDRQVAQARIKKALGIL